MMRMMIIALAIVWFAATALAQEAAPSASASKINLDHGISFVLPEGWEIEKRTDRRKGDSGRLSVSVACETEDCERTQETCTFTLLAEPSDLADDAQSIAELYSDPSERYFRLRAVRISTSKDAQFRRMLAPMRIGPRDWQVVETDARHNMKSGLFAETFIAGQRVGAICKTCETGEIRHRGAMAMLESVSKD